MLQTSHENTEQKSSVSSTDKGKDSPPKQGPVWKVLIFFVPLPSGGMPKPPNDKSWVEVLLLVIKVLVALAGLWKAIALLSA